MFDDGDTSFNLADIDVSDPECTLSGPFEPGSTTPALSDVLDPGNGWQFLCSRILTSADVDDPVMGTVSNTAALTATDVHGTAIAPRSAETTLSIVDPSFSITKEASPDIVPASGSDVTFTVTVVNTSTTRTTFNALGLTMVDPDCAVDGPFGDDGDGQLGFVIDPGSGDLVG